jgi:type II secretory pathway component PulC
MKHRLDYGLLVVTLMFFLWVPALVNPRAARAELEPLGESPPLGGTTEPGATLRPLDDRGIISGRDRPNIPLAAQDLGLKLIGTGVAEDPGESLAVIENLNTGSQWVYHEGDRLGEVLIRQILHRNVVIDTGMGDEILSMDGGGSIGGPPPPQEIALLDREEVESTIPEYMQLMREIRVRPHLEGGQPGGGLIYNIEPESIFARMGLENGDVITAVNGEPVTITQQAADFYEALMEGGAVALGILRDENAQELRFEIQ